MAFTPMPRGAIPYNTIRLSDAEHSYLFEVFGNVPYQNLAAFPRKNVIGDVTKDDDDLISAYITLFDTSGGGQVLFTNEATDQSRFYYSTLRTTEPNLVCLNRETISVDGTYPLGDYSRNDNFYFARETDTAVELWYWDATSAAPVNTTKTLASTPVNLGVTFQGDQSQPRFWIPLGAAGIAMYDGVTVSTITTVPGGVVALYYWSNALYALGRTGVLWRSTDGAVFTDTRARVDGADTPHHLAAFYNRADTLVLYAITNRAAYAYDDTNTMLFETDLSFPPHPDNGKGAARWRDSLHAASGMMVYSYNGGVMGEMGPTRRDSLPSRYRGTITDLRPGHNALYVLIAGSPTAQADPEAELDFPTIYDDPFLVTSGNAVASLMAWTQLGWHTVWVSPGSGPEPNRVYVSGADGEYRLWWGANGTLYTQQLERDFHNPAQGLEAGVDRFATDGYIETGWFDAQMEGWRKLASHLSIKLRKMYGSCTVKVFCMVDQDEVWDPCTTATLTKGKTVIPFGVDANGYSFGQAFDRIRFRLEFSTTDPRTSPILDNIALYFIKIPNESAAWTVQINLAPDAIAGLGWDSPEQLKHTLEGLLEVPSFLFLEHMGSIYRVRLAATPNGDDAPGQEVNVGRRILSLVEVQLLDSDLQANDVVP